MSGPSTGSGPLPAYCEEVHEESQTTIPDTKQEANTGAKRSKEHRKSKRDAASDSGYSSLTATTRGSSSQESKDGSAPKNTLTRLRKMANAAVRKSPAKEPPPAPKAATRKSTGKPPRKDNPAVRTLHCEGREDAAKMRLSGAPVKEAKPSTVHQHTTKDRGPPSPTKVRSAPEAAGPTRPVNIKPPMPPRVQTLSFAPQPTARPASYHEGFAIASPPYVQTPPQIYHYHQPPPPPPPPPSSLPNTLYMPTYQHSPTTYVSAQMPHSPNRQISYPFPPTVPPHYAPPQWQPEHYYPQPASLPHNPAPIPRRYSIHGPRPIVEYPRVPPAYRMPTHPVGDYAPRRRSFITVDQPAVVPSPVDDEAIFLEDQEAYYRRLMPPPKDVPQRPAMRHSATTTSASVPRRAKRQSLEIASHSPRKQSFEEPRPASRPSVSSRSSSTKKVVTAVEAPVPPTIRKRPVRPVSYHSGVDPVTQAEEYQAMQKSQDPLTAEAIKQVSKTGQWVRPSKSRTKGGSESGSRASSGRDGSDAKNRASLDKYHAGMAAAAEEGIKVRVQTAHGMRIDVLGDHTEGQTFRFRHGADGDGSMEMSIGGSERSRYRESRPRDRDRESMRDRAYSVSSRQEIRRITERGESAAASRRRSSSRSVMSRADRQDSYERLEERLRQLNLQAPAPKHETAIEDEDEGDKAKNVEMAATERLRKLRTGSQSRRSSRSTTSRRNVPTPAAPLAAPPAAPPIAPLPAGVEEAEPF